MPRVVHFDIPADQPERAVRFYSEVFGWKAQKWEGAMEYWLVTTGPDSEPGINGGIGLRQYPNEPPVNTIGVSSLEEVVEKVKAAGGEILVERMAIPGVGWYASCNDSEGNRIGLMEDDPDAA